MRRNRGNTRATPFCDTAFRQIGASGGNAGARTAKPGITRFGAGKRSTKPFWMPDVVVLKQSGDVVGPNKNGGRAMSTIENDSTRSEGWDPALWSIGTVLGVAIVYLACLT